MNKDTGKKVALGAAIAGAVGYLAGVLTAPKSGKETRQDIKDTANKFVRESEKKLKELNTELSELIDKASELLKRNGDKAKAGFDKSLQVAKDNQAKVKEVISALRNGEADHPELKKAIKEATKAKEHLAKYLKEA